MTAGEQIQKESYLLASTGAEMVFFPVFEAKYSWIFQFLFQANFFFSLSLFSLSLALLPGTPVLPIHSDVRGSESAGE